MEFKRGRDQETQTRTFLFPSHTDNWISYEPWFVCRKSNMQPVLPHLCTFSCKRSELNDRAYDQPGGYCFLPQGRKPMDLLLSPPQTWLSHLFFSPLHSLCPCSGLMVTSVGYCSSLWSLLAAIQSVLITAAKAMCLRCRADCVPFWLKPFQQFCTFPGSSPNPLIMVVRASV